MTRQSCKLFQELEYKSHEMRKVCFKNWYLLWESGGDPGTKRAYANSQCLHSCLWTHIQLRFCHWPALLRWPTGSSFSCVPAPRWLDFHHWLLLLCKYPWWDPVGTGVTARAPASANAPAVGFSLYVWAWPFQPHVCLQLAPDTTQTPAFPQRRRIREW